MAQATDAGIPRTRRRQAESLGAGAADAGRQARSLGTLAAGRDPDRRPCRNLPQGSVPYQPWAEKLYKERRANDGRDDPTANCIVGGVPRSDPVPYPFKVLHEKDLVVILYEAVHSYRQIFADGRSLPEDMNPSWFGYSVGRWEKDTFVVETAGFNDKGWLDNFGKPATDKLRVTEKFVRKDFGHMDILITIDDPGAYTKPWDVTLPLILRPTPNCWNTSATRTTSTSRSSPRPSTNDMWRGSFVIHDQRSQNHQLNRRSRQLIEGAFAHAYAIVFVTGLAIGTVMSPLLAQGDRLPGVNNMNHVAIAYENFDEAFEFYTKKMGFKEGFTVRNAQGQPTLSYIQASRDTFIEIQPANANRRPGLNHYGLHVADLKSYVAALKQRGVMVEEVRERALTIRRLRMRPIPLV